jgi:hypothetical protein
MRTPAPLTPTLVFLACLTACNPEPTTDPSAAQPTTPTTHHATPDTPADPSADDPASDAQAKERERARETPPPAGLAAGIIADFESGELLSDFGAGWQKATDAMRGGSSTVELDVQNGALRIVGTIDAGAGTDAWAGAMFFPGDQAMRPANLDSKPTLVFQARGDGPLMVMLFAEQRGEEPAVTSVEIGHEWAEYRVDLRTLVPEPYDVTAIFFGGPARAGKFELHIDDVRLR